MKHFNFKSCRKISINLKRLSFLTLMFVFGYQSLYSQCKLERSKDDFDSGQTVSSKEVTLASVFPLIGSKKPWDLVMSFLIVDGTCNIIITHKDQALSSNLSYIYFKFKDGEMIKKDNAINGGTYNTGLGYIYETTIFPISKEELAKFGSEELMKFRASLKHNIDYPIVEEEIKQKNVEKIKQDASCILDEINSAPIAKKEDKADIKQVEYVCNYTKDVKDAFTKKRIVDSNGAILYDFKEENRRLWLSVVANNTAGINGLQLEWGLWSVGVADKTEVQTVLKFNQADILLENEDIVSLTNNEIPKFVNKGDYYISFKLFSANDSIWGKLKSLPVKSIRLTLNNDPVFTEEVAKENSKSFINVINCIDVLGIPKSK